MSLQEKSFLSVLHAFESNFFCEPSIFHADVSLLLCIWCSCWKANRQWVKALINHQLSLVGRIWGKPEILSKGNVGHSSRYDYGRGLNLGGKCKQGRINPAFVRLNLNFWALHVFIYKHKSKHLNSISIVEARIYGKWWLLLNVRHKICKTFSHLKVPRCRLRSLNFALRLSFLLGCLWIYFHREV